MMIVFIKNPNMKMSSRCSFELLLSFCFTFDITTALNS